MSLFVGSFVVMGAAPAAACEEVGDGLVKIGCPPPDSPPSSEPSAPSSSPTPQPSPAPAPSASVVDAPDAAAELLALANAARAEAGVAPLAARVDVVAIAAGHSRTMAGRGDIWHNDAYFSRATRRQLDAARLGENVALNADVADAHRRLMASPPHRANLLDGRFTVVGIAVARDARGTYYVTQDFLTPAAAAAVPPPAPSTTRPPLTATPLGDVQPVAASATDASPAALRSGGGYARQRAHIHPQNEGAARRGTGVAGVLAAALLAAVGAALVAFRRVPSGVTARRWDR